MIRRQIRLGMRPSSERPPRRRRFQLRSNRLAGCTGRSAVDETQVKLPQPSGIEFSSAPWMSTDAASCVAKTNRGLPGNVVSPWAERSPCASAKRSSRWSQTRSSTDVLVRSDATSTCSCRTVGRRSALAPWRRHPSSLGRLQENNVQTVSKKGHPGELEFTTAASEPILGN